MGRHAVGGWYRLVEVAEWSTIASEYPDQQSPLNQFHPAILLVLPSPAFTRAGPQGRAEAMVAG